MEQSEYSIKQASCSLIMLLNAEASSFKSANHCWIWRKIMNKSMRIRWLASRRNFLCFIGERGNVFYEIKNLFLRGSCKLLSVSHLHFEFWKKGYHVFQISGLIISFVYYQLTYDQSGIRNFAGAILLLIVQVSFNTCFTMAMVSV